MSKTALLFPGLDALFVTAMLKKWAEVPAIQEKLNEASSHLAEITNQKEDLLSFVRNNRRLHIVDFDRTLVVLTTFQVAIADLIKNKIEWDIYQGCSHGDLARNVVTKVISFKDAIDILWIFSKIRKECPEGYTATVRSTDFDRISEAQLKWIDDVGANLSTWSERHGTIGGSAEFIEKITREGAEQGLKIKPILSYPVHSKAMEPIISQMTSLKDRWTFHKPQGKIFSSLWLKFIDSGEELFKEGIAGAVSPVKWVETLTILCEQEGVDTFINVGPSNTLTAWLLESEKFKNIKIIEAWDLINDELPKSE